MKIDGACLCGQFRYEAEINPDNIAVCHCTDCQVHSATAFRVGVMVPADKFKVVAGALKVFVKTAESGKKRALSFCPECGTSIHGSDPVNAKNYSLRLGTARQWPQLEPKLQMWRRSAVGWIGKVDGLKSFDTQPERRPATGKA